MNYSIFASWDELHKTDLSNIFDKIVFNFRQYFTLHSLRNIMQY